MLKINKRTRLAVLILSECARHPRALIQTADAARAAGTTTVHAAGIVHMLMTAGLLQTRQGRRGGIRLSRPAASISIGAVMRVTETQLVDAAPGEDGPSDPIDAALAGAASLFWNALDGLSIADLAPRGSVCPVRARRGDHPFTCPLAAIAALGSTAAPAF